MRVRLRDDPTDDELAAMYRKPHDASLFGYGHGLRVATTIELVKYRCLGSKSIADLSCGNAAIVKGALTGRARNLHTYLGDFAPGYQYHGPIEETILQIPRVDVFVCSETIEHLSDPDGVLAAIRSVAKSLILSTPIGEVPPSGNPEHLWGWDQEGVAQMLAATGWDVAGGHRVDLMLPPDQGYCYQMWSVS